MDIPNIKKFVDHLLKENFEIYLIEDLQRVREDLGSMNRVIKNLLSTLSSKEKKFEAQELEKAINSLCAKAGVVLNKKRQNC